MPKKQDKGLIVALDIGTSKIAVLIGEANSEGHIEIIGFGTHPSKGLRRGVVVNIETTVQSISRALEDAELMAGVQVHSAFVGIAGSHIRSLNSHGIVAIRDREVGQFDVDRVIDAAKAVAIPSDQQILHILPQEFMIDDQRGVKEPVGMSGVRLESKVHIVTGSVSSVQNITKCVGRCGMEVGDIVLEQLASSNSVLSADEQELGVCLIDIGGGTTDIAIFVDGAIRHTAIIPIAGDQVTSDIAIALRTPTQHAEAIKIESGTLSYSGADTTASIEVPSVACREPRKVHKSTLIDVIAARYEELFQLIRAEVRRAGFQDLIAAGYVLTGGGAKVPGLLVEAERIFDAPVRMGLPTQVTGLMDVCDNPSYATGVGLLMHGARHSATPGVSRYMDASQEGLWKKMRTWFQGNF